MRVKLLSLAVGEMTSLSRIIRSSNANTPFENKKVEIQVRDLFTKQFNAEEEESIEPQINMQEVIEERNRLLSQAHIEIEMQKAEFEKFCQQELENIEQLKQLWEEEQLVLQQQAYEQGFQQGYEEGIQKANSDMAEHLKVANETIHNARENAKKHLESQEQVILELGLTAAERILGSVLERDDELFISIIKRGLKEAHEMKEIKIYVSPKFYRLVTHYRDELAEMFPTDVPFFIFVNEDLDSTESYIETNHGRIVLSIDEQLNELRLKLNEILESKE